MVLGEHIKKTMIPILIGGNFEMEHCKICSHIFFARYFEIKIPALNFCIFFHEE